SSLATKAGIFRQYHTSAQNDYIYTLFLTGDWGGQKNLLDHFEKTENPRRILPMNLYYHFYSGIKRESMEALKIIYDYIRENNFAAIFTSEYCRIVEDFYFTRLWNKNNIWWCENNGYLRTLRFKGKVNVDIAQSEGVVGYCHFQNQTYVHLDGSKKRKITLSSESPSIPYIHLGSYFVDNMITKKNFINFKIKGFGKMYFQIAGFAPDKLYNLRIENEKKELIKEIQVKSNLEGLLDFKEVFNIPIENYGISIRSPEN
ncbi:MAG: hypothetical protein HYU63_05495, partial [Armatimonadetes bacterium]|nr:hypothetical protein [Armatimonadota bacterium]